MYKRRQWQNRSMPHRYYCYIFHFVCIYFSYCICLKGKGIVVLNATSKNISVISWWSVLLVEYLEKTTDLSQVTDKLSLCIVWPIYTGVLTQKKIIYMCTCVHVYKSLNLKRKTNISIIENRLFSTFKNNCNWNRVDNIVYKI